MKHCGIAALAGVLFCTGVVLNAEGAGGSTRGWLAELNYYRVAGGDAAVTNNTALRVGVRAHLNYLLTTPAALLTGQFASVHTENPQSPAYTALGAQEGARSNLSFGVLGLTGAGVIDDWLGAPFHAVGLLRRGLTSVSFARDGEDAGLDVLSGLRSSSPTTAIVFPGNGTTTTLTSYSGAEWPNPLETCGWSTTGTTGLGLIALVPFSVTRALSAVVVGPLGRVRAKDLCIVDAATYVSSDPVYGPVGKAILVGDNAVIVFARKPLTGGLYSVNLTQPGQRSIAWSFTEAG